jgi:butyrate kinase
MEKHMRILAINPGSTSTKISVFDNHEDIFTINIKHSTEELCAFSKIIDQFDFRKQMILKELEQAGIKLSSLDVIVARGGLLKPIPGGVYKINDAMIRDLKDESARAHSSNLGAILAHEISTEIGNHTGSYIVDPVIVDELEPLARYSGMPDIPRISIFHALNQKAVARKFAREHNVKYEDLNLIIVHMGGGITVGAHRHGRVIDVNNGLDGEGPFSPERSGDVPVGDLVNLCYSGKYTLDEMKKKITGQGGLVAYLGTNSAYEVSKKVKEGDKKAEEIYRAMAYQISKEIGAISVVLEGKIDGIILTGGVAYDELFCKWIEEKAGFLGKVVIYPGEDEMKALEEGVYYAVKGEIEIKEYI